MNRWDYALAFLLSIIVAVWSFFGYVALAFIFSQVWRFTFFYFLFLIGLLFISFFGE